MTSLQCDASGIWNINGFPFTGCDVSNKDEGTYEMWCKDGIIHREDGPARIFRSKYSPLEQLNLIKTGRNIADCYEWIVENKHHRVDGPAKVVRFRYESRYYRGMNYDDVNLYDGNGNISYDLNNNIWNTVGGGNASPYYDHYEPWIM